MIRFCLTFIMGYYKIVTIPIVSILSRHVQQERLDAMNAMLITAAWAFFIVPLAIISLLIWTLV